MKPNNTLTVEQSTDETGGQAMARKLLEPHLRHAVSASSFASKVLGAQFEGPGTMDYVDHIQKAAGKAEAGDLAIASRLLASQAITLDAMFTEMARRAALNMGEHLNAAESYGRLALKAQSNCRATLETLAKLHQPREQTVRHVHVNEGGQAVIADQFHHHAGGIEMPNLPNKPMHKAHQARRCLATTRAGSACQSPAVRGKRRCRMHGGAAGSGAKLGNRNAWKHGRRSAETIRSARYLAAMTQIVAGWDR